MIMIMNHDQITWTDVYLDQIPALLRLYWPVLVLKQLRNLQWCNLSGWSKSKFRMHPVRWASDPARDRWWRAKASLRFFRLHWWRAPMVMTVEPWCQSSWFCLMSGIAIYSMLMVMMAVAMMLAVLLVVMLICRCMSADVFMRVTG